MTAATHYAFSCLVCTAAGVPAPTAFAASAISLLPDIDHPESMIGRLCPSLSRWIMRRWGHRTVTHSLFAVLAVAIALLPLLPLSFLSPFSKGGAGGGFSLAMLYAALLLAFSSHIFIDLFNRAGVKLFAPVTQKEYISFRTPALRIPVRSWQEYALLFVILVLGFSAAGEAFSLGKLVRSTAKLFYLHYDGALTDYEHASKNICTAKIEYFDPVRSEARTANFIVLTMFPENIYLLEYDPDAMTSSPGPFSSEEKGSIDEAHSTKPSPAGRGCAAARVRASLGSISITPDVRLILKKDIINEIEITDTGRPRSQTRLQGRTLRDLARLPSDAIVSGTIVLKNYQPVLRNSDYIRVSHSPTATTITLVCALTGELGEILALEQMRNAELETLKAKQSTYQIARLNAEVSRLDAELKTLSAKGFYANYARITRLNDERKKIESRIDSLRMRETSGADADTVAKIEQMESAYGVEYDVWLTKL